ncbi:hypothetical protein [Ruminococcus flavefaciens]|uniref:hypothetical protein n=1 Tax=Ruminococcus flavefaciens TaxID=1265 RepID=UPI0003147830|nr:hypothetical protein [Ruminococcus flavefaciens]
MKKFNAVIITLALLLCSAVSCSKDEKATKSFSAAESSEVKETETTTAEETEKTTAAETTEEKTIEAKEEKTTDSEEKTEAGKDNGGTPAEQTPELEAAKEVVKKYVESSLSADTTAMIECMYPKEVAESIKSSGMMDSMAGAMEEELKESKVEDLKLNGETVLSEKAVEGAGKYFESMSAVFGNKEVKCNIKSGYSIMMNAKETYKGKTEDISEPVCVVLVDGEGWKIVPIGEKELEEIADMSAEG